MEKGYLSSWLNVSVTSAKLYRLVEIYEEDLIKEHNLYMILGFPNYMIKEYSYCTTMNNQLIVHLVLHDTDDEIKVPVVFNEIENICDCEIGISSNCKSLTINEEVFSVIDILCLGKTLTQLLYVGKSTGIKEERCSLERLREHKTLQKIMTDTLEGRIDKEICILTFGIAEYKLFETFTPLEYSFNTIDEFNDFPELNKLVNITEAILINTFKPLYNDKYSRGVVPSPEHISYIEYYKKEYNYISLSLDLLSHFIFQTETLTFDPSNEFTFDLINGNKVIFDILPNFFNNTEA